ncbi:LLM class F420-dependent oxidoreductase [Nocardioides humi]|uniref:LLM class F420-dependent oxidoreductase n=1 Tax=Nocardioides humi TaxID=449461 RepID=A0ABN2A4I1_9ACTN|nr:LLM class F420-dependent oxidoreductase [Nocardioides humi]
MRIDVVLPQTELPGTPHEVAAFAELADRVGFGRAVVYDHVLGAEHADRSPRLTGPYDEHTPFHEPFVLMGYLAAITTRIELMTGVLVLPQRQTALVAKQAAEVQSLSGGRLVLGVGVGWNHVEYESLGMPFAGRGAMLEEQVQVLGRLWSEPSVTLVTARHRIDRASIAPRPASAPALWFGGSSRAAYARAVRLGDGLIVPARGDDVRAAVDEVEQLLADKERDRASFGIEVFVDSGPDPSAWPSALDRLAGLGVDRVAFRTIGQGLDSPAAHLDVVAAFAAQVAGRQGLSDGEPLVWRR